MALMTAKERYQLVVNASLPIAVVVTPIVCRALGVLFVLLAVGYIALIRDLQRELYSSREHGSTLLSDIRFKTMDLTSLPIRAHKDIGLTSNQSRGMPVQKKHDDTKLIDDLSVLAEHAGLNISAISLGTARLQRFYRQLPIDIQAHGDFAQLARFVGAVESMNRWVVFEDIDIVREKSERLAMDLHALSYTQFPESDGLQ